MRFIVVFCLLIVVVLAVNADEDKNQKAGTGRPDTLVINKRCGIKGLIGYSSKACAKECANRGYPNSSCPFLKKCTCKN